MNRPTTDDQSFEDTEMSASSRVDAAAASSDAEGVRGEDRAEGSAVRSAERDGHEAGVSRAPQPGGGEVDGDDEGVEQHGEDDRGRDGDDGDVDGDDAARDEGDIAADFLEELLDISDIDGDLEIEERDGRMYVSVRADGSTDLDRLAAPEVVDALQQVTRLAVQAETGEFSRLILDIGGSRDARKRELSGLVDRAIERLEGGAASAALPPMSSYERKLVHDIAAERGYVSESEGEGKDRHTVLRRA